MRRLFLIHLFIFLFSITASAESIPYEKLVGVWTSSQRGVNHDLTDAQVSELCGSVFSIVHPDRHFSIHIRARKDGKLLMSMDVQSKNPCTYADNQLSCELESNSLGKSLGEGPGFFGFQKVRDGVFDLTAFNPDGKTVDKVQTMYPCSMTIPEALAWVKSNSGSGELGEQIKGMFPPDKVAWLMKKAEVGNVRAQAGMGGMYLMAAILNTGVEHDPELFTYQMVENMRVNLRMENLMEKANDYTQIVEQLKESIKIIKHMDKVPTPI